MEFVKQDFAYDKFKLHNILGYPLTREDIFQLSGMKIDVWNEYRKRYGHEETIKIATKIIAKIPEEILKQKITDILEARRIAREKYYQDRDYKLITVNGVSKSIYFWSQELKMPLEKLRSIYRRLGEDCAAEVIQRLLNGEDLSCLLPKDQKTIKVFGEERSLKNWCKTYKFGKDAMRNKPLKTIKTRIKAAMTQSCDHEILTLEEPDPREYIASL